MPSADTLDVYVQDLMRFQSDDIEAALTAFGKESPKSFEKRWPEVGLLIAECERQEKQRKGFTSKIKSCENKECIIGMVRVFDRNGWPTGVVACPCCGGPSWFHDALDKNKWTLKENGR